MSPGIYSFAPESELHTIAIQLQKRTALKQPWSTSDTWKKSIYTTIIKTEWFYILIKVHLVLMHYTYTHGKYIRAHTQLSLRPFLGTEDSNAQACTRVQLLSSWAKQLCYDFSCSSQLPTTSQNMIWTKTSWPAQIVFRSTSSPHRRAVPQLSWHHLCVGQETPPANMPTNQIKKEGLENRMQLPRGKHCSRTGGFISVICYSKTATNKH